MGPKQRSTHVINPSTVHAKSPSQARRARHANKPSSLTHRALQPVISQALVADTFIEQNNEFWPDEYGCATRFWGYCRENKTWHYRKLFGPDMRTSAWMCDNRGEPHEDYVPAILADIRSCLAPLLETASAADQRRCGAFPFITGVFKLLQLDPRIVVTRRELRVDEPPRCLREEQAMERSHVHY